MTARSWLPLFHRLLPLTWPAYWRATKYRYNRPCRLSLFLFLPHKYLHPRKAVRFLNKESLPALSRAIIVYHSECSKRRYWLLSRIFGRQEYTDCCWADSTDRTDRRRVCT